MAAAALGLVVLVPALLITMRHGFDGLYGQDAFAYVDYALGPLTDTVNRLEPPPSFFWPPGYPLLVSLLALISGLGSGAGLIISLAAGALVPILVAFLARALMLPSDGRRARYAVPLLGGVAIAVSGQLWQSSVVAMSDAAALAAATLGALLIVRYHRRGDTWALLLGAAATTFAIEIRLVFGFATVALFVLAVAALARVHRRDRRRASIQAVGALVVTLLVAAPTVAPVVAALAAGTDVPFVGQIGVHSWDPANALRASIDTADGRLNYSLPTGAFYLLQPLQWYWFAALALLAIPGIALVVRRRDVAQLAVLILWPALVLAFLIGDAYQNTRFLLAAATPLAVLIAFGALAVWRFARRRWPQVPVRTLRGLLVVGLVIAVAINALLAVRFTNSFVERFAADNAAIRMLAGHVPPNGRLISLGPTALLRHDGRDVTELYYLDPDSILTLVADGRPTFILVDDDAINGQWRGRSPEFALRAVEEVRGLRRVTDSGIWTLYEVAPI